MGTSGINSFQTERLVEMRKKNGFNQAEAARRMHLSLSGYSNFERGERTPSWQTIQTMALALGTSVWYLTGETDDPSPSHILLPVDKSADTAELLSCFRRLTEEEKDALAVIIRAMTKDQIDD